MPMRLTTPVLTTNFKY